MEKDESNLPVVGATASRLGVRPIDIAVDATRCVSPNNGGMSVVDEWRNLSIHRIPKRLKIYVEDACGKNEWYCFRCGEGSFLYAKISVELQFRPDPRVTSHGYVEPNSAMRFETYVDALAATRAGWIVDES